MTNTQPKPRLSTQPRRDATSSLPPHDRTAPSVIGAMRTTLMGSVPNLLPLFAFLCVSGCAAPDTELEVAFCDGLQVPAARTVTASPDGTALPDVTDAARVDVTLNEAGGEYSGFVSYRPDEVGNFAFGFTQDVDIVVRDAAGQTLPVAVTVAGAETCMELAVRHTVSVPMDTLTIEIVGATEPVLGIIAEESDDDR